MSSKPINSKQFRFNSEHLKILICNFGNKKISKMRKNLILWQQWLEQKKSNKQISRDANVMKFYNCEAF